MPDIENARVAASLFVSCLLGAPSLAQEVAPEREWIGGRPITEWTRLTGDWGGLRTDLEAAGVEVSGAYVADLAAPWSGGLRSRSSFASLLDVNVAFDLEALLGLPSTYAYVDAYSIAGRSPSRDIGDFQGVSNIQNANLEQIAEVWVETWVDAFRFKVGKVDFNSEFAVQEIGGDLVSSTAAISPAIVAYPTFPNPATSINVFYTPSETFYVGLGMYDGAFGDGINTGTRGPKGFFSSTPSDSYFYCLEVGAAWRGGGTWGSGRTAVGCYHHTATFARFDGGTDSGTEGGWATVEQRLWRENPQDDDGQGIGMFATVGVADDQVSACGSTLAIGFEWGGPIDGRDFDVFACGLYYCDLSDRAGAGTPNDETVFEVLYKVQVTPALSVKPELQYVSNPGGVAGVDDVLVALLRVEMLF